MDITAIRKSHKLTQAEIASRIGVNQTTISRWESGELTPNSRDLIAIQRAVDELVAEKARAA